MEGKSVCSSRVKIPQTHTRSQAWLLISESHLSKDRVVQTPLKDPQTCTHTKHCSLVVMGAWCEWCPGLNPQPINNKPSLKVLMHDHRLDKCMTSFRNHLVPPSPG